MSYCENTSCRSRRWWRSCRCCCDRCVLFRLSHRIPRRRDRHTPVTRTSGNTPVLASVRVPHVRCGCRRHNEALRIVVLHRAVRAEREVCCVGGWVAVWVGRGERERGSTTVSTAHTHTRRSIQRTSCDRSCDTVASNVACHAASAAQQYVVCTPVAHASHAVMQASPQQTQTQHARHQLHEAPSDEYGKGAHGERHTYGADNGAHNGAVRCSDSVPNICLSQEVTS